MTSTVITDEVFAKAEAVYYATQKLCSNHSLAFRTALEAVAPMILEEAAKVPRSRINRSAFTREQKVASDVAAEIEAAIRALRQDTE